MGWIKGLLQPRGQLLHQVRRSGTSTTSRAMGGACSSSRAPKGAGATTRVEQCTRAVTTICRGFASPAGTSARAKPSAPAARTASIPSGPHGAAGPSRSWGGLPSCFRVFCSGRSCSTKKTKYHHQDGLSTSLPNQGHSSHRSTCVRARALGGVPSLQPVGMGV